MRRIAVEVQEVTSQRRVFSGDNLRLAHILPLAIEAKPEAAAILGVSERAVFPDLDLVNKAVAGPLQVVLHVPNVDIVVHLPRQA